MTSVTPAAFRSFAQYRPAAQFDTGVLAAAFTIALIVVLALAGLSVDASGLATAMTGTP